MTVAVFRSALRSSGLWTREISPRFPRLKVPIRPYARQNFFRDWIKPTEKTIRGANRDQRAELEVSAVCRPIKLKTVRTRPISETNWRRLISALPRLQVPGMYEYVIKWRPRTLHHRSKQCSLLLAFQTKIGRRECPLWQPQLTLPT